MKRIDLEAWGAEIGRDLEVLNQLKRPNDRMALLATLAPVYRARLAECIDALLKSEEKKG